MVPSATVQQDASCDLRVQHLSSDSWLYGSASKPSDYNRCYAGYVLCTQHEASLLQSIDLTVGHNC